jgi:hypothetical protein
MIIADDLSIKGRIPFIISILIWEFIIFFNLNKIKSFDILLTAIIFIILPIVFYYFTVRELRKVIFNQKLKIIQVYNIYKIIKTINTKNIWKIKYYTGKEFIPDYGKTYYARLEIINENREVIFHYKTKEINFLYDELVKENIIVELIDEEKLKRDLLDNLS